jgi:hypothetical protein
MKSDLRTVKQLILPMCLAGFLQPSCAPILSPTKSEWLNTLDDLPKERLEERWLAVQPSQFSWVKDSKSREAEKELQSAEFLEIQITQLSDFVGQRDAGLPPTPGLRAFVVRGVCFGSRPDFATVQISALSNTVHVFQGTVQPEIYFPGAMPPPPLQKRPMLLLLHRPPDKVLVTADFGGDRVLRWFHPSNSKFFSTSKLP